MYISHILFVFAHNIFVLAHILCVLAHNIFVSAHILFVLADNIFVLTHFIFALSHIIFVVAQFFIDVDKKLNSNSNCNNGTIFDVIRLCIKNFRFEIFYKRHSR